MRNTVFEFEFIRIIADISTYREAVYTKESQKVGGSTISGIAEALRVLIRVLGLAPARVPAFLLDARNDVVDSQEHASRLPAEQPEGLPQQPEVAQDSI